MTRPLKVWGITVPNQWREKIGGNSQIRLVVKAASRVEAVRIIQKHESYLTVHFFNQYASETGNDLELALTDGEYRTVWVGNDDGWLRIYDERRDPCVS